MADYVFGLGAGGIRQILEYDPLTLQVTGVRVENPRGAEGVSAGFVIRDGAGVGGVVLARSLASTQEEAQTRDATERFAVPIARRATLRWVSSQTLPPMSDQATVTTHPARLGETSLTIQPAIPPTEPLNGIRFQVGAQVLVAGAVQLDPAGRVVSLDNIEHGAGLPDNVSNRTAVTLLAQDLMWPAGWGCRPSWRRAKGGR